MGGAILAQSMKIPLPCNRPASLSLLRCLTPTKRRCAPSVHLSALCEAAETALVLVSLALVADHSKSECSPLFAVWRSLPHTTAFAKLHHSCIAL
jgi:hypothetical protein